MPVHFYQNRDTNELSNCRSKKRKVKENFTIVKTPTACFQPQASAISSTFNSVKQLEALLKRKDFFYRKQTSKIYEQHFEAKDKDIKCEGN